MTAPSVHRARAHAGVDVRGPSSPPPVGSSPPGAGCRHSALRRTVGEAAHCRLLREGDGRGGNRYFQPARANPIVMLGIENSFFYLTNSKPREVRRLSKLGDR